MLASIQTVHTRHTTAVIYAVIFYVDAGSLTLLLTQTAVTALLRVDYRAEQRKA